MTFRLFVDSTTGIDVEPEWNYRQEGEKIEDVHRARSGRQYRYKWGEYNRFIVPVEFVNSEFKATVNSWWGGNTELKWMEEGGTQVYSVIIANATIPIGEYVVPYQDLFMGVIELESY